MSSDFAVNQKQNHTMRTLTDHKVNEVNAQLNIAVVDEPGQGGANHRYEITGADISKNASTREIEPNTMVVLFQNGPIKEFGVNGVTQEALLAIVADRLRSFQAGQYACRENAVALTHIETAMLWLHKRTLDRLSRGVEGTNVK